MSFFDELKKKAQGLAAQVNVRDGGATYASTVNAPKIQTPSIQAPRPIQPIAVQQPQRLVTPTNQPLNIKPVQTPALDMNRMSVAAPRNLNVGTRTIAPTLNRRALGYDREQQIKQLLHPSLASQVKNDLGIKLAPARAAASEAQGLAHDFVTRPVVQVATSLTNKQRTVTANNPVTRALVGNRPIENIQKGIGSTYDNHSNLPTFLRAGLAGAYGLSQVANDAPIVGTLVKGASKGAIRVAPTVARTVREADRVAFTPRIAQNDVRTLVDHSNYLAGDKTLGVGTGLSQNITKAREIAQRNGINITQGPRATQLENVNKLLDNLSQQNKGIAQGGFIRVSNNATSNELPAKSQSIVTRPTPIEDIQAQRVFEANPMNPVVREYDELYRRASSDASLPAGSTTNQTQNTAVLLKSQGRQPAQKVVTTESQKISNPLPIYNTTQVSNIDKALRSTRSIIERQGESGKQLATMLQGARDNKEITLGDWQKKLPTVSKLARSDKNRLRSGGDFENFVEATQGLAKPNNAKVEQAIKEWQAFHPEVRNRAVNAGLEVGDLGPQYYPHFNDYDQIFKDQNMYNKSINHLIETGQAPNEQEARKLLDYAKSVSRNREFGNLEASRTIDLPFYDKSPNSLIGYLNGSAKRIAHTETFGAKDEKALKLLTQIGHEGGDHEAAKEAFDVAVGAKKYNPKFDNALGNVRKYTTTTRLGLGALTNVSQSVNTGIVTGHLRTLAAAAKQFDQKTKDFVADTGVISDALLSDMRSQQGYKSFSSKVLGNALNKITAPGFSQVEKFNRSLSATAGRDYALRLAQNGDEATLRKLGVTGEIKGRTLSDAQQVQAARKVVEKTQFKVDPQDLPGWADSPGGKLVSQFRTFSYAQSKFVSNEILKPAFKNGDFKPLARFMAALPVGYALYETRRAIDGRPGEDNGAAINTKEALAAASKIGGFGLIFDMYQGLNPVGSKYIPTDRRVSMSAGTVFGPTAGTVIQGIGAASELSQRKNTPDDLTGKLALNNSGEQYTDATPAARFALQQIPIVGTPIKNRVLPFKKQADAEAGNTAPQTLSGVTTSPRQTASDAVKVTMTSPEAKKFLALSASDQKALAASDPAARALYDQQETIKTAFKAPSLHSPGLSQESARTLNRYDRLTPAGKNKFDADFDSTFKLKTAQLEDKQKSGNATADELYTAKRNLLPYLLAKQAGATTSQDYKMFKESPYGIFQTMDQQYQLDKANGKISQIDDYQLQDKLYKAEVQSKFSKDAVDIMGMSEKKIDDFLSNSKITDEQYAELQALDAANVDAGIYKYSKLDGSSGGSGGGGGGKSLQAKILTAEASMPRLKNVAIDAGRHFGSYKVSTRKRKGGTKIKTISTNPKVRVK